MFNFVKNIRPYIIALCIIILFLGSADATILKTDIPENDVPISAEISLGQYRFMHPMQVDVKIVINPAEKLKNTNNPFYLYAPDGKIIREIGSNGEIYIEANTPIDWSGTVNVGYRDLNAGVLNFIIKYPIVLKNKNVVYKNYDLPVQISRIYKKDLAYLDVKYEVSKNVAAKGDSINIKYIIKNIGILTAKNIILDNGSSKFDMGTLKPKEQIEKDFTFTMPDRNVVTLSNITFNYGLDDKQSFNLNPITIYKGIPFIKVTYK
ncbi:MAG: hypothetical protein GYA87_05025 [Christensenellaceae bacterium]|nr:hypothetical protein [Christensenellaceae bacterium]